MNMALIPFSLYYHPAYLAAAYLQWTKDNIQKMAESEKPLLPTVIAGHAWFKFVDPAIDPELLAEVTEAVTEEIAYFFKIVSQGAQAQSQEAGAH